MFYELVAGSLPFGDSENQADILRSVLRDKISIKQFRDQHILASMPYLENACHYMIS